MYKSYIAGQNAIIGDYINSVDFSGVPREYRKRRWVPNWLWNLISEVHFIEPETTLPIGYKTTITTKQSGTPSQQPEFSQWREGKAFILKKGGWVLVDKDSPEAKSAGNYMD